MPGNRYRHMGVWVLLALSTIACGTQPRKTTPAPLTDQEKIETNLTFKAVTLEEFDKQGKLWWRVKAKQATYTRDKKVAQIQEPEGEFFQDGKAILKVSAKSGEVRQDGKAILLKDQIIATDLRDGLVLKGKELEWQPQKGLLLVRNEVTGTHKQLKAAAKSGTFYTRKRQLDLEGQVLAESTNPAIRFATERLVWNIPQQTLAGDRQVQLDRFENNVNTERATASKGTVSLATKIATLTTNAEVILSSPPAKLTSNNIVWNVDQQTIRSQAPITVSNANQGIILSGSQGDLDLTTQQFNLVGSVKGISQRNQGQLGCDQLVWNIGTQDFEATGNVSYQQGNPPLNLIGPKASGNLQEQRVVVSNGAGTSRAGSQVVTEIVP